MSDCVEAYVSELSDSYRAVLLNARRPGPVGAEIAELLGDSTGSMTPEGVAMYG